jgi:hypothetical protein
MITLALMHGGMAGGRGGSLEFAFFLAFGILIALAAASGKRS